METGLSRGVINGVAAGSGQVDFTVAAESEVRPSLSVETPHQTPFDGNQAIVRQIQRDKVGCRTNGRVIENRAGGEPPARPIAGIQIAAARKSGGAAERRQQSNDRNNRVPDHDSLLAVALNACKETLRPAIGAAHEGAIKVRLILGQSA